MKFYTKFFFTLTILFSISAIKVGAYDIELKHLSCYSSDPSFSISPSGKYLAILTTPKDNVCDIEMEKDKYVEEEMRRTGLTLLDLETMNTRILSDGSPGESISYFKWVTDERFIYRTDPFEQQGRSVNSYAIFAVNLDGSERKKLLDYKFGAEGLRGFDIYNMNMDDPDHVFVYWNDRRSRVSDYYKLNVKTGSPKLLAFGPDIASYEVIYGSLEDSEGYPVVLMTDVGIQRVLYTYDKESKEWSEHYRYTCQQPHFVPLSITSDGLWLVSGQKIGPNGEVLDAHDTNALYLYDPATKSFGEKLYEDPRYDVGGFTGGCRSASGSASVDPVTNELVSINYVTSKPTRLFFDDEAGTLYKTLEATFPNDYVSIVTRDSSKKKAVIRVWGSNNPGDFYYLDMEKGSLTELFKISPWLDRSKLSKAKFVEYKARDGLKIGAYLSPRTYDAGGNYFVILPHGGPNVKQSIGYDRWVQFFASRGFNVLQPDYRGSTGYGRNHYVSGNKQWGKTMQDDLTDGVKWAIDNGYADGDKVCIAGASYGGYAAMAGAVFTPNLYKCVINFVGVADMRDLLGEFGSRSSRFNTWEDEGRLEWGDDQSEEGKKLIQEISPLLHVSNITAPVLISHGTNDNIVPIEHARRLKREMDKYGKEYVYHTEAYEGHGFYGERAVLEHFEVQEAFLEKYATKN